MEVAVCSSSSVRKISKTGVEEVRVSGVGKRTNEGRINGRGKGRAFTMKRKGTSMEEEEKGNEKKIQLKETVLETQG